MASNASIVGMASNASISLLLELPKEWLHLKNCPSCIRSFVDATIIIFILSGIVTMDGGLACYLSRILRQPLLDGGDAGTEFNNRFCCTIPSTNLRESILLNLWWQNNNNKDVERALVNLVEAASTKKHAISGSVAIEGVLAIYLLLFRAVNDSSDSKSSLTLFKPTVIKAIEAGSSTSPALESSSFLFHQAVLDAIPTNATLGLIVIPCIIAMHTKLLSKQLGDASPDFRPLIAMYKSTLATSRATQALAISLLRVTANNGDRKHAKTPATSSTIQSILTYQPTAAPAILNAPLYY